MKQITESEHFLNPPQRDLKSLIDRVIHPFGRYQAFLVLALTVNAVIANFQQLLPVFHVYTPTNFTCIDEEFQVLVCVFVNFVAVIVFSRKRKSTQLVFQAAMNMNSSIP